MKLAYLTAIAYTCKIELLNENYCHGLAGIKKRKM